MPSTAAQRAMLIILDGWGLGPNPDVDAIAQAKTPHFDRLWKEFPHHTLGTSGEDVGLPEGQMGNSEVGHLNIGAGRVVYQELARINKAIREGSFATEPAIEDLFRYVTTLNPQGTFPTLHLMGLLSDGGVHSHIDHLIAICQAAKAAGVERVRIHAFTDGRDTAPDGGQHYLARLMAALDPETQALASLTGRYYAMDRDHRWERVKIAYDALVHAVGESTQDPLTLLKSRYAAGEMDEFIKPIIHVDQYAEPFGKIQDGDAVFFFNFRTDRPRQLTEVLTQQAFPDLDMHPLILHYLTMTRYDERYESVDVVYTNDNLEDTLGEVLAKAGKSQLRIAETEKYPHVTFFFNGGREVPFSTESRIIVPSPKVATYDLKPDMSAYDLRDQLLSYLDLHHPDVVVCNFANTDMVGHTGVMSAAVAAAEAVDSCLGAIVDAAARQQYALIIIADHGNADIMINPDGSAHTAHTTNPVPIIYVPADGAPSSNIRLQTGKLADVAPTLLALLGIEQPAAMDGVNLLHS